MVTPLLLVLASMVVGIMLACWKLGRLVAELEWVKNEASLNRDDMLRERSRRRRCEQRLGQYERTFGPLYEDVSYREVEVVDDVPAPREPGHGREHRS